ncbi:oxygen-dependent protoporphyrinogen oxidase [Elasticomyces elasticus]|nr:oxygen-dependent protoporphyrinogen oxidase [Elasticomyces elasticus]
MSEAMLKYITRTRRSSINANNIAKAARYYASFSGSSEPSDVAILGGGITGIASAYYLSKALPATKITIYETGPRMGGWLSSKRLETEGGSILFEAGPRTLRPDKNGVLAARMIQELGLQEDTIFTGTDSPAARMRLPHPTFGMFQNLRTVLSEPLFKGIMWPLFREFLIDARDERMDDESVGSFMSRRISKNIVDQAVSAMIHGIYAGDVWQLSIKSLFPSLWRYEKEYTSIAQGMLGQKEGREVTRREQAFMQEMKKFAWDLEFTAKLARTNVFTFREGLSQFSDRIVQKLKENKNVVFKLDTAIKHIARNEHASGVELRTVNATKPDANVPPESSTHTHAISTLSAHHLSAIALPNVTSAVAVLPLVPKIPAVTVMTVNLYFRTPDLAPPGFGYLIPLATSFEQNSERALGVVFDNAYSPSKDGLSMFFDLLDRNSAGKAVVRDSSGNEINPRRVTVVTQDTVPKVGTKVTVMLGGHYWDGWPAYPSEQEGLEMALSILKRHLNISERPLLHQVNLSQDCIPQYHVGHESRLKTAHQRLKERFGGRLRVAGSWIEGVGVNDCLRSAWDVVKGLQEGPGSGEKTGLEMVGQEEAYARLPVGLPKGFARGKKEGDD